VKENTFIEFKSSFNDSVIETLTAFANTKGGKVIVGVNDKGNPIEGFKVGNETIQKWINEIKVKTQPSIIADAEYKTIKGKGVVELSIQEFPVKPVAFKQRFFKRVNNSNHVLNASEISNLYMQSLQVSWDSYPFPNANYSHLNQSKIKAFIKKVNDGGRFLLPAKPKDALLKLKLISDDSVSQAAMILFSNENLRYNVHIGRFKTTSLIIDDKLISGNLFEVVQESMQFILSHLKVAFEIKGTSTQRAEIFEYPIPAIRELLLNAIIHRDYSSSSDVQIKIFDQKISFFNPGNLFGNIDIKDLSGETYASQTRNKLIAEAFYLTKDIEKYGSGFLRIRNEIKEFPTMRFKYQESGNGFLAELHYTEQKKINTQQTIKPTLSTSAQKNKVGDRVGDKVGDRVGDKVGDRVGDRVGDKVTNKVTDKVTDNLSATQNRILELITKNAFISAQELSESIGISKRKTEENIHKLKEKGKLQRLGSPKSGHWQVL
jgi:ATP-dependent DNA helicase RecG